MSASSRPGTAAALLLIVGSFSIVGYLVTSMKKHNEPPPVDQKRVEERYKNLAEIRGAGAAAVSEYAWQDKGKGFVRLPISRAVELVIDEYRSPESARKLRVDRADKLAVAPPPPPNAFE